MESSTTPTAVGNYRIESLLGEGAMGSVYRALGSDGGWVAVKLISPKLRHDPTFLRRFEREARIAQTVKHPNLVDVLEVGEHDGLPYMVQRFVAGRALDCVIREDGPLTIDVAVRICSEVASGLEALWGAGVVHRDIKPANILVSASGTAFICDFGLAKDTQRTNTIKLTLQGQALGTLDYIPPEQIRGEPVTAASDVYALGCMMFECLTGRALFGHLQGMRALLAHLHHPPPDPRELRPELSEAFAQALSAALAKDPAERPGTAGEYARVLAAAL